MAVEDELHRFGERHLRLQEKRIPQHQLFEPRVVLGEQEVAHRDDAEQLAGRVSDVAVRDEGALHERAQLGDRLGDGHLRPEHRDRGLHQLSDGIH
jgi:hypothetical protein